MRFIEKYQSALQNLPAPGDGLHPALLRVANFGTLAGLCPEQLFEDLRGNIPAGGRSVSNREIQDAIRKAISDFKRGSYKPKVKPSVHNGKLALQKIISQGRYDDEADLWEESPLRLLDDPAHDPVLFLKTCYKPTDILWIGKHDDAGIPGGNIKTAHEWIKHFESGGTPDPFIIINPLTGKQGHTKEGKPSYRADGCIAEFRYTMVEFDNLSFTEQIKFWTGVKLPIVALVFTGGKSIHAWLSAQQLAEVKTLNDWDTSIKTRLYDKLLIPLGVDGACKNPARLSRMPGHYRIEKEAWQRLLWLSPEGVQICL